MEFKARFLNALRAGADDDALLKLARESATETFDLGRVYNAMQAIWREHGFDERSDGGSIQDRLEFVMEKVWYESPARAE